MATITLRPDGTAVSPVTVSPAVDSTSVVPRRVELSRGAVELLAELTRTPLPWSRPREPTATERALGAWSLTPPDDVDPEPELRFLGLLSSDGDLFPELSSALAVFGSPEVLVEVDVSMRHCVAAGGFAQVHSWHRLRGDRITTISTAGGVVELCWFADDRWQVELARAVTLDPPETILESPAQVVCLPHELLLGSGEAIRLGRDDVLAELLRRHGGEVRVGNKEIGVAHVAEQVRLLHSSAVGRMRTVVSGRGADGSRRIGWVSWSLFPDGWRALTPYARDGLALVRMHPVEPLHLGVEVARLVTGVRP